MKTPRIIGVHLLNDFSGSPFVFSQALQALQKNEEEVHLFTATPSGNGFLNTVTGIHTHKIFYRWSPNKFLTLFYFLLSQISLFFKMILFSRSTDIIYVNSILPFGAALAGKVRGAKVIYHVHEVSIKPVMLKKFLLWVMNHTATKCLYVSKFLQKATASNKPATVIYNSLPESFREEASRGYVRSRSGFTVLMLCSLKKYKGVDIFFRLAQSLPTIKFVLVLNASDKDIQDYFAGEQLPRNLKLVPAQKNVHPFYRDCDLVLNLSLPHQWVETFGMTVLEAMVYGRPVIVPPVGGVAELVDDGIQGFLVDSRNEDLLQQRILEIANDQQLYLLMSAAAKHKSLEFSPQKFEEELVEEIQLTLVPDYSIEAKFN